nr:hypothetical protein Iba_chr13aCG7870 [Ipomoea batatas]GMD82127.1 hypothetical protein Iba_chr13fCG5060 [Ipomoea batatas]
MNGWVRRRCRFHPSSPCLLSSPQIPPPLHCGNSVLPYSSILKYRRLWQWALNWSIVVKRLGWVFNRLKLNHKLDTISGSRGNSINNRYTPGRFQSPWHYYFPLILCALRSSMPSFTGRKSWKYTHHTLSRRSRILKMLREVLPIFSPYNVG